MKRGFQSYIGYLQAQGDYFKHSVAIDQVFGPLKSIDGLDFWDNTRPMFEAVGNYSLDIYNNAFNKVLRNYIKKQDTQEKRDEHPLFIYLAHQTVHIPLEARRDEVQRCGKISHHVRRIYCSMMVELDDAIGEMIEQLKTASLWEDTLILVMTDNGGMVNYLHHEDSFPIFPASQGSNYPLRGSKTTMFEGGVRSLGFLSGGFLPSQVRGTRYKGLAHAVDFSATILTVAGILPLNREVLNLDGHNLLYSIFTQRTSPRDHIPINIVSQGKKNTAVRFGKYKLIISDEFNPSAHGWFDLNGDLTEESPNIKGEMLLFNVEEDPEERSDISNSNQHLVQIGLDLIESYIIGGDYMEPQKSAVLHTPALPWLHRGTWSPFMKASRWNEEYESQRHKQKRTSFEIRFESIQKA